MRALEDRIIIKIEKKTEEKTTSGFVITNTAQETNSQGIVVEVGPGRVLPSGKVLEPDVKVGDKVLFDEFAIKYFELDNEEYVVIFSKDILAIIEE
jgi:chaperonin GroES